MAKNNSLSILDLVRDFLRLRVYCEERPDERAYRRCRVNSVKMNAVKVFEEKKEKRLQREGGQLYRRQTI